jgi:FkbM family methyltransferase
MIASLLYRFNHARVWQQQMRVWNHTLEAASLDRLLYLTLHRLGWMGENDARLLRALVRPGMQIVDVGANIGLYSLLCASLTGPSGRVFAFEPDPNLFAALSKNCTANDATNVVPFELAAGSAPGRVPFQRSAFNSGDNSLDFHGVAPVEVEVVRVDEALPVRRVDFIKVDVQGHEMAAFAGMDNLLRSSPDVRVVFEFSPAALRTAKTEPEALLSFFSERDFRIYATDEPVWREIVEPARLIEGLPGRRYTNLVASRTSLLPA